MTVTKSLNRTNYRHLCEERSAPPVIIRPIWTRIWGCASEMQRRSPDSYHFNENSIQFIFSNDKITASLLFPYCAAFSQASGLDPICHVSARGESTCKPQCVYEWVGGKNNVLQTTLCVIVASFGVDVILWNALQLDNCSMLFPSRWKGDGERVKLQKTG